MNLNLDQLGWTPSLQQHFETLNDPTLTPARVVRQNRDQYTLNTGDHELIAILSGSFKRSVADETGFPTVGDWVALRYDPDSDIQLILELLPRHSHFTRQAAGKDSSHQLVAANFDYLFLVNGLDGDFNPRRIQRYLSLAWNSDTKPVIVLNKVDLCPDLDSCLQQVKSIASGVPIHPVCATDPTSLAGLSEYFAFGKTVALLGSSGVGKSTLVNSLMGETILKTQSNRDSDSRGRHTTTWRELLLLPQGSCLIDLPGMRELQLTGEEMGMEKAFADIEAIARNCHFRNCRHQGEPGCAVEAAVEDGRIEQDRYLQYSKLKDENRKARARRSSSPKPASQKQQAYQEKKQRFKNIAKEIKRNSRSLRKNGQMDGF